MRADPLLARVTVLLTGVLIRLVPKASEPVRVRPTPWPDKATVLAWLARKALLEMESAPSVVPVLLGVKATSISQVWPVVRLVPAQSSISAKPAGAVTELMVTGPIALR